MTIVYKWIGWSALAMTNLHDHYVDSGYPASICPTFHFYAPLFLEVADRPPLLYEMIIVCRYSVILQNISLSHLIGLPSFPFCSHNKVIMFLDFIRNEYTFSQTPFCQCSSIILCIPLILYANHKTLHILYPCHVKYMVEMF